MDHPLKIAVGRSDGQDILVTKDPSRVALPPRRAGKVGLFPELLDRAGDEPRQLLLLLV